MTSSAVESHRRQSRYARRLLCGVAAVIGFMAAGTAVGSAQETATNPPLRVGCGLKVMLVLDESYSIRQTSGALAATRTAANDFVEALDDTGTHLAITAFHSFGRRGVPNIAGQPNVGYMDVTSPNTDAFHAWINNAVSGGYNPPASASTSNTGANNPNGTTNWEDGFNVVGRVPGGPPDLLLFVTDGDPNTVNAPGHYTSTATASGRMYLSGTAGTTNATNAAVLAANEAKQHSRVFALGVGAAVNNTASEARLRRISGDVQGSNPITADYQKVGFGDLKGEMSRIVAALCGSRMIITKYVSEPGVPVPDEPNGLGWTQAQGWAFTTKVTPPPQHVWLHPNEGTEGTSKDPSADLTTGPNGDDVNAEFRWRLESGEQRADVSVQKHEKDDYRFVLARCQSHLTSGVERQESATKIPDTELGREEYGTCQVYNQPRAAKLQVVKRVQPSGDTGRFNLLVNGQTWKANAGHGGTTEQRLVRLGEHTVTETAGQDTDLAHYASSIRCVDRTTGDTVARNPDGPDVTVDLTSETQDVVCTITNRNTQFGNLTVVKNLVPEGAPGRFDLLVSGPVTAEEPNVGHGGALPLVHIPFGPYDVSERVAAGQTVTLDDYQISTVCEDVSTGEEVGRNDTGPAVSVALSATHDNIVCTITNSYLRPLVKAGLLQVRKRLKPSDDPGLFNLRINGTTYAPGVGDGGETASIPLELGTHRVSESGAQGTDLGDYSISITCRNHGEVVKRARGPAISVTLEQVSDVIVCTVTNQRKDESTLLPDGGGQVPPDPCPDAEECANAAAAPNLAIGKQMPAHARAGQRVPITIAVKNVGQSTAQQARLYEKPPSGTRIVRAANGGSIRSDGTAVWRLGNLRPGQTRTVRATLLITRRGLHLNMAVASASNADPAVTQATVRASAAPHRPRGVTG